MMRLFLSAFLFFTVVPMVQAQETSAQEKSKAAIKELCARNIEGSAVGTIGEGKFLRMNIFCIDRTRLGASAYIEGMPNISLTFSGIHHGVLVISQFPLDSEGHKAVSATTSMTYVKLNGKELLRGRITGFLINGNLTSPLPLKGAIKQRFPSLSSMVSTAVTPGEFIGTYSLQIPDDGGKVSPASMWVDLHDDNTVFNMKVSPPVAAKVAAQSKDAVHTGGIAIHFIDGPDWDGKSGFEASTAFGDTNTTGVPLWHLRGRVVKAGVLELYFIDPLHGMRGPVIATRQEDPSKYLQ